MLRAEYHQWEEWVAQLQRGFEWANREQLQECLRYLWADETLVVSKLDWLARSILHLTQITHDLEQRNINLVVIDQAIDTTTATGTLLFNMFASNIELETAIRAERQVKGIVKVYVVKTFWTISCLI